LPVVVIDFETTGLHARHGDAVIEVGAVRIDGLRVRDEQVMSQLVDPGRPVSTDSLEVHGIEDEQLEGKPGFADVLPELERWMDGRAVVAHNAPFDLGFLRMEAERAGEIPPRPSALDTVLLARAVSPGLEHGYGLDAVASRLDLCCAEGERHRAAGDALLTAHVYVALARQLMERGLATLEDLQRRCTEVAIHAARFRGSITLETVRQLQAAIRERSPLAITYVSPHGRHPVRGRCKQRTRRVIEPIGLNGLWLDAWCRLREDHRTFRLDRILDLERIDP
jgi:DNA polymerase III epsilon subunit